MNCDKCNQKCTHCGRPMPKGCNKCESCGTPCDSCPAPVFSVEALSTDPSILTFNVNGVSITYDFSSVVKEGETATALVVDTVNRLLNYYGEKSDYSITAKELGSIIHLSDLGDVDELSLENNGILNYRKQADCSEGCENIHHGWVSTSPLDVGTDSLTYLLGSDADGSMFSLLPPSNTNKYSYLSWAGSGKISWQTIPVASSAPTDSDGKVWRPYIDPNTNQIVYVKENA